MAKKITVRTVKKKSAVEIQPDASGPPSPIAAAPAAMEAPDSKSGLSVAAPVAAAPGGFVSDRLANPFEDAADLPVAAPGKGYAWQAILMCVATALIIGICVIQFLEWSYYFGLAGDGPVFMKTQPVAVAPRPMAPPPAPEPEPEEEAVEAPVEAPAE